MHFPLLVPGLVLAACLIPLIHAVPKREHMFEVLRLDDQAGQCSNDKWDLLVDSFPKMHEAMAAFTARQSGAKKNSVRVTRNTIAPSYGRTNYLTTQGTSVVYRTLILCDSTGLTRKQFNDSVPWNSSLTIGALYGSGDQYYYYWSEHAGALGRVWTTDLPPASAGHPGAGSSFCAKSTKQAWHVTLDRFEEKLPANTPLSRSVIVLCPNYFDPMLHDPPKSLRSPRLWNQRRSESPRIAARDAPGNSLAPDVGRGGDGGDLGADTGDDNDDDNYYGDDEDCEDDDDDDDDGGVPVDLDDDDDDDGGVPVDLDGGPE